MKSRGLSLATFEGGGALVFEGLTGAASRSTVALRFTKDSVSTAYIAPWDRLTIFLLLALVLFSPRRQMNTSDPTRDTIPKHKNNHELAPLNPVTITLLLGTGGSVDKRSEPEMLPAIVPMF